jgi:hypothetical protein
MSRALLGAIALSLALATEGAVRGGGEPYEEVTLTGTVVTLPEALSATGLAADPEPIAAQVVLKAADGTLTPLLSDTASRALFRDERLRNRRAEISGRRYRGLPYLRVVAFRVDDQGTLRTPEYHCEICKIQVRYPQTCPCCQGKMELRMKPDRR